MQRTESTVLLAAAMEEYSAAARMAVRETTGFIVEDGCEVLLADCGGRIGEGFVC